MFDPFCGSGTTLIEAQAQGYPSIGVDLNPIACLIARVATSPQPPRLETSARRCAAQARQAPTARIPPIPNLDHWFKQPVQAALASILETIDSETTASTRDALRLALSSTITRISNQDSDTRYAAVAKDVTGDTVYEAFLRAAIKCAAALPAPNAQIARSTIHCRDVLELSVSDIDQPIGLVICSPPYPNAYEYWLYHKYRMYWLGHDPLYVKEREIGARPHYFRKNPSTPADFRAHMAKVFRLLRDACIDGSYACFVVGHSKIHGHIIDNGSLLKDAAAEHRFEHVALLTRNIAPYRKAFNLSHSRAQTEDILVFQKRRRSTKAATISTTVYWHPYRYLPYEKIFALRELAALPGVQAVNVRRDRIELCFSRIPTAHLASLVYFSAYDLPEGRLEHTVQAKIENGLRNGRPQARQSTRYGVHGLHEYKGKFNPQIVRGILNTWRLPPGSRVLDPFCGSGTTLVEAAIGGFPAIGCDLNPFAVYLSNAKLAALRTSPSEMSRVAESVLRAFSTMERPSRPASDPRARYLRSWFAEESLNIFEAFREAVMHTTPELGQVFLAIASNLLRSYSLQEPSDLRIRRRRSTMPTVPLREAIHDEIRRRLESHQASYDLHGPIDASSQAVLGDIRAPGCLSRCKAGKAFYECALTSPPYAAALPYIDTQRLSLVWLGLLAPGEIGRTEAGLIGSREAQKSELDMLRTSLLRDESGLPQAVLATCRLLLGRVSDGDGFRRKAVPVLLYRYFLGMRDSFLNLRNLLRRGGLYALVVGTNRTTLGGKEFAINTPQLLGELGEHAGWRIHERIELETYRRYGLHAANAVQDETLLVLKNE